jgi:hypothetical protein
MKLRFNVNQAVCFRKGVNCPLSIVTIDVDPAGLPLEKRGAIADRLHGIDVLSTSKGSDPSAQTKEGRSRVIADGPSFEDLWRAIEAEDAQLNQRKEKLCGSCDS